MLALANSFSTQLGSSSSSTPAEPLCLGSVMVYNWGTFTDCQNGTVKFVGVDGTFGGYTYTAKTLYFAKCTFGQTYDSSGNTCTGTATSVKFCSTADESCVDPTTKILNGFGTSEVYSACKGFSLAGKTWRVPTIYELKLLINCNNNSMPNNGAACASYTSPAISSLFPNTPYLNYFSEATWSSTGDSNSTAQARYIYFLSGFPDVSNKTNSGTVRCISGE